MISTESNFTLSMFPKEAIDKQIQRIIADPAFNDSLILKNFLVFVVNETLKGNANQLKEYTIAVNVLAKPAHFRPQESGIVRIHAGRLRRALSSYYTQSGVSDKIRVSMPKGGYVPSFNVNDMKNDDTSTSPSSKKTMIGIAPLRYSGNNQNKVSFAEKLGIQLSAALRKSEEYKVVPSYTMKKLSDHQTDIEHLAENPGIEYLLTGDVQLLRNNLRVHLQMINLRTGHLTWSQMYERKFSPEILSEVQNDIVKQAVTNLSQLQLK